MYTQAEVRELRVGRYVLIDEEPCKIMSITTSKPGKHGAAKARLDAMGIFTGQKRTLVAPVTERCQVPIIERKMGQVISMHGTKVQMMDLETYETFEMEIPADEQTGLEPGKDRAYMSAMGRKILAPK